MTIHTEYLINEKGQRKSVVLSMQDYGKLLEYLEDLEDAVDLKKSKESAKTFVDFDHFAAKLRKQGRVR